MRVDSTVGRNPTAPGMYKPLVSGIFEPSTIALLEQKQQTRCQVERIHRDLVRQRDTFGRSRNFSSRWIQVGTLEKTFSKLDSNKSIEIIVIWRMLYFKESLRCDPWKHDDVNKNRIQNKGIHFPGSPIRRWHEWKVKFAKKRLVLKTPQKWDVRSDWIGWFVPCKRNFTKSWSVSGKFCSVSIVSILHRNQYVHDILLLFLKHLFGSYT